MSTEKSKEDTKAAATPPTTTSAEKPFTGMVAKELLPEGVSQIKAMPKKFMYRGYEYKFQDLTKKDIERMMSYSHNNWFKSSEKTDTAAKA